MSFVYEEGQQVEPRPGTMTNWLTGTIKSRCVRLIGTKADGYTYNAYEVEDAYRHVWLMHEDQIQPLGQTSLLDDDNAAPDLAPGKFNFQVTINVSSNSVRGHSQLLTIIDHSKFLDMLFEQGVKLHGIEIINQ